METIELDFMGNFKFFLPQALILAISIYYYMRKHSLDGLLLILGSGLSLCILLYHLFILPYGSPSLGYIDDTISLSSLLSILSLMSSLSFVAGFLMLIIKQVKLKNNTIENDIQNIK